MMLRTSFSPVREGGDTSVLFQNGAANIIFSYARETVAHWFCLKMALRTSFSPVREGGDASVLFKNDAANIIFDVRERQWRIGSV